MERKAVKDVMSIKELAEYVGLSKSKIYQLIRNKKVPASKIGRQYKFSKDIVDAWLKENIITGSGDIQMRLPIGAKKSKDTIPANEVKLKKEEVNLDGKKESSEKEGSKEKEEIGL